MTYIPMIILGLGLVALVRYFQRIHPDVVEITETRRIFRSLEIFGISLAALGLIALLLLPGEARAQTGLPRAVEELQFYFVTKCGEPYAVMWVAPNSAGSAHLDLLNQRQLRQAEALRRKAIEADQYYLIRTRSDECAET